MSCSFRFKLILWNTFTNHPPNIHQVFIRRPVVVAFEVQYILVEAITLLRVRLHVLEFI